VAVNERWGGGIITPLIGFKLAMVVMTLKAGVKVVYHG